MLDQDEGTLTGGDDFAGMLDPDWEEHCVVPNGEDPVEDAAPVMAKVRKQKGLKKGEKKDGDSKTPIWTAKTTTTTTTTKTPKKRKTATKPAVKPPAKKSKKSKKYDDDDKENDDDYEDMADFIDDDEDDDFS